VISKKEEWFKEMERAMSAISKMAPPYQGMTIEQALIKAIQGEWCSHA
jgi:hypothetical protein